MDEELKIDPETYNVAFGQFLRPMCGVLPVMYVLDRFERGVLRKAYPQFNPHSRVEMADDPYSVRREFLYSAFGRRKPHSIAVKLKGLKARLWRTAGELFDKPLWKARGHTYVQQTFDLGETFERTVEMKRYGLEEWYPGAGFFALGTKNTIRIEFAAGYEPLTDTLFLYRPPYMPGGTYR